MSDDERNITQRDAEFIMTGANQGPVTSENAQLVQALSQSEERFRAIFETARDPIFIKDRALKYIQVNPAMERLVGFPSSKLIGLTADDILDKKAAAHSREIDKRVLDGEIVEEETTPWINGAPAVFHVIKVPMRNAAGEIIGLYGIARDIAKRKQVEEALRKAHDELEQRVKERTAELSRANAKLREQIAERKRVEEKLAEEHNLLRTLIDNLPDFIFVKDCESRFVLNNSAHLRALRATNQDEVAGKTDFDIFSQELAEQYYGDEQAVIQSGHPLLNREEPYIDPAGERRWLSTTKVPLRDSQGEIIGLVGMSRDITESKRLYEAVQQELVERKRAEETHRESEAKYRALIEQSNDAIYVIYGNRFEIVNPKFEELFGVTLEDANAPDFVFTNIVAPKSRAQVLERARKESAGQRLSPRYEFTALDKAGDEIEVELSVSYPTYRGGLATQGVVRDITERKRAEAALAEERALLAQRVEERTAELSAANAELARAARLKDEFLASMSHELRTPLNAVLGISESLQEEVYGPLNEKQLKSLRSIQESGRHLLSLINDILDLSKIEAGKLELQIDSVPVGSVCQASLRLIKQMAHTKRLKVSSTLDSSVTTIQADPRRLKQILVNLLSNAVKFTPEGGSIGLEVVGEAEQEVVHFTVWDTGIGISKEDMGRLFQSFVQVDSSLTRQHAGTGLGLSLIRRLTEMHGGGVSLESEVGQGSRFTISLPWRTMGQEAKPAGEKKPLSDRADQLSQVGQSLILLMDDNETNIYTMSDYLLARGYRVVVARNGSEALERARDELPGLILMDIQMPGMDGLEATRRFRTEATPGIAAVPIIAVTALAMPGDRERCIAAGANDYLSKPISLKRLIEVIEAQLQKAEGSMEF